MVQNFAVALTGDPQELQDRLEGTFCGNSAGSGVGNTPGVENAEAAEIIDGGRPAPGNVAAVTLDACELPNPIPLGIVPLIVAPAV